MKRAFLLSYWQAFKANFPETWLGKLAVLFTLYTVIFMTYEFYHIKQPTLHVNTRQLAATDAAAAASQWTAYSNWVNTICPAERVRSWHLSVDAILISHRLEMYLHLNAKRP